MLINHPINRPSPSLATAAALVLATASQVQAIHASFPSGDMVSDIPAATWNTAFQTPNATSNVTIPSWDVTAPWAQREPGQVDWALTIQVKDDVPHPKGDFVTATWIKLDVPDGQVSRDVYNNNATIVAQHPTFRICASIWTARTLQSDATTLNTTCKGFLSDKCFNALTEQVTELGTCTTELHKSCRGQLDGLTEGYVNVLDKSFAVTERGEFDLARDIHILGRHEAGNTTAYDEALRQVYVTAVKWANDEGEEGAPASLVCLRAGDGVVQGSRGVQPMPSGGVLSARIELGSVWAMVALVGVASVWKEIFQ